MFAFLVQIVIVILQRIGEDGGNDSVVSIILSYHLTARAQCPLLNEPELVKITAEPGTRPITSYLTLAQRKYSMISVLTTCLLTLI